MKITKRLVREMIEQEVQIAKQERQMEERESPRPKTAAPSAQNSIKNVNEADLTPQQTGPLFRFLSFNGFETDATEITSLLSNAIMTYGDQNLFSNLMTALAKAEKASRR